MQKWRRYSNAETRSGESRFVVGPKRKARREGTHIRNTRRRERWANVTEGRISGDEYTDRSKERRATLKEIVERYAREISPNKKGHASEVYRLRAWAAEEFAQWSFCLSSP